MHQEMILATIKDAYTCLHLTADYQSFDRKGKLRRGGDQVPYPQIRKSDFENGG